MRIRHGTTKTAAILAAMVVLVSSSAHSCTTYSPVSPSTMQTEVAVLRAKEGKYL